MRVKGLGLVTKSHSEMSAVEHRRRFEFICSFSIMADYDGFVVHRWEFDSPREHQFLI